MSNRLWVFHLKRLFYGLLPSTHESEGDGCLVTRKRTNLFSEVTPKSSPVMPVSRSLPHRVCVAISVGFVSRRFSCCLFLSWFFLKPLRSCDHGTVDERFATNHSNGLPPTRWVNQMTTGSVGRSPSFGHHLQIQCASCTFFMDPHGIGPHLTNFYEFSTTINHTNI